MIYIFEDIDKFNDECYLYARNRLSQQRLEYIEKFSNITDKYLSVIAYLLLSYGLKREYNISEPQEFIYSKKGKPYLKSFDYIYFGLSHCKRSVCCAVSDKEVGIDIEYIRDNVRPHLIKRVCSAEEQLLVEGSDNPGRQFVKFWTMKEAYLKMTGIGIGTALDKINDKNIPECRNMLYREKADYIMACTEDMEINILDNNQLLNF